MSLRIRQNGRIFCAAHSDPEPGDFYLDDYVHEYISGCADNEPEQISLHWYDWKTHEYFIDGGIERTSNAIRLGCPNCMVLYSSPCKKHKKDDEK